MLIVRRWGCEPIGEGAGNAAIHAGRAFELTGAVGTGALAEKNIEGFPAFTAAPDFADGRGRKARGTTEAIATG